MRISDWSSDVCSSDLIAIDKQLTKQALVPHGIPMPGGRIVHSEDLYAKDPLPRPYVLKPVNEGSSVGVAIVTDTSNYGNPIRRDVAGPWREFSELLAEPFIRGRELTTAVIDGPDGPRALGVTELKPKLGFYDYDVKYTEGRTETRTEERRVGEECVGTGKSRGKRGR